MDPVGGRPLPPEATRPADATSRPRPRRRVVIKRQVSASTFEKHKERMETLGLDPADAVPSMPEAIDTEPAGDNFDMDPELPMPSPSAASSANGDAGGRVTVQETQKMIRSKEVRKTVSLKTRTVEEQILAGKYDRALDKFAKQQEDWEKFRRIAAKKTGRDKEDLVVTRAEEFRERAEVMELLDRATPDEVKSGGHNWYHSLRGEGTRFVQIGNMFSGLFLPIKLHKENYVHEIVRKPLLQDLHVSRNAAAQSGKKKTRTWRDDEYLQARIRRYGAKMKELAPGKLDFDELLQPEVKALRPEDPYHSDPEEGFGMDETGLTGLAGEEAGGIGTDKLELAEEPSAPSQISLKAGPHAEVMPDKLEFSVHVNKMCTQRLCLKNTGTAVIHYEWIENLPQHGFHEAVLPDDPTVRFTCHETKGQVLPGEEVQTRFSFTSKIPGTFTGSWRLKTYPEIHEPINELFMNGTATLSDLHLERRGAFQAKMSKLQTLSLASELAEDIVASVRLQPPPLPDLSMPLVQERLFEEVNEGLYWNPLIWQRFVALGGRVEELMPAGFAFDSTLQQQGDAAASIAANVPQGARGRRPVPKEQPPSAAKPLPPLVSLGVPSATRLEEQLSKLPGTEPGAEKPADKIEVIRELKRACRDAQKPPLERSEVWWLAYETVMDIVSQVPGKWAASRQRALLEPLPFVHPPDQDVPPELEEQYQAKLEERKTKKVEDEKEAEVRGIFERGFMRNKFGPAIGRFSAIAKETKLTTRVRSAGRLTFGDRLRPYLGRQSTETAEVGGCLVLYEVDFGFMAAPTFQAPAPDSGEEPQPPQLVLQGDVLDQLKQRLQGVLGVLESGPLAIFVMAHLGEPEPDKPIAAPDGEEAQEAEDPFLKSVRARMATLPSLEPILELLAEVVGKTATTVEFVPHDVWMGDSGAFAAKARNDEQENKVYLLENLSAIPEETGVCRAVHVTATPEPGTTPEPGGVPPTESTEPAAPDVFTMPWASREGWAARVFRSLVPEFHVQDSLTSSCKALTLGTGLWPRAPLRIIGPYIEAELAAFLDALQLPFRASPEEEAAAIAELEKQAAEENDGQAAAPAPLLVVLGGGGFGGGREGEEALLKKLELLIGLSRLTQAEKGGVQMALGGELACCILSGVLGLRMGRTGSVDPAGAIGAALREALLEVMKLGVKISLPIDLVCEAPQDEEVQVEDGAPGPTVSLIPALRQQGKQPPVSLGFLEGREQFILLDPETGALELRSCEPGEPLPTRASPEPPEEAMPSTQDEGQDDGALDQGTAAAESSGHIPETWAVRDVGQATIECMRLRLRRCHGALFNGSLGCWEDELWQRGTKDFLKLVEDRMNGVGEDDEDDEDEEDEEEDEEEEDEGEEKPKREPKPPKERRVDFDLSVVVGRDSRRMVQTLMESPSSISFVSSAGDGLLQIFRGVPLPGILACLKTESKDTGA